VDSLSPFLPGETASLLESPEKPGFPTTRWSRVRQASDPASPEAREALTALCLAYWFPVYAYIRRKGYDPDRAADLAQDSFVRLPEKETLAAANPVKGRFRAYLLADCAFFLADARDHEAALKRGGGVRFLPLDAEGRYRLEPVDDLTPDRLFDRAWALSLLAAVVARLKAEFASSGKLETFQVLKVVLTDGPRAVSLAELARRLGSTEGAAQVAVHRLRERYKSLVREQIVTTVDDPAAVEDEIRALFAALA
jgi:DNA-directed RNA polymerase specialized sigma24 family protein